MIIKFDEKPVYEKIWTGEIDQILSYNTKDGEVTVRSLTGEERTHGTALDCMYLSFSVSDFQHMNYECVEYVIKKGVRHLSHIPERFLELIHNTKDDMEKLIEFLQKINNGEIEVTTRRASDGDLIIQEPEDIVNQISGLACSALITSESRCYWQNINELKKLGFDVYAGEKDSFGWLTGCIQTEKGVIIYG